MTFNSSARSTPDYLRLVLRQVPGIVWATDRDLRFTYVHGQLMLDEPDAQTRLVGTTLQEFVGSRDPTEPALAHHLAALAGERQTFQYERRGRWFDVILEPLRDEASVVGCVGAAIDVTERRQAEERLARSEARLAEVRQETLDTLRQTVSLLESTLAATADGILVVDREGRLAAYNQRFLALWHVPKALAARGDDAALLAFVADQLANPAEFLDRVQELYASPTQEAFDTIPFRDGRVFERYSTHQIVNDSVVGRVWSFRDVTERHRVLRRMIFLSDATRLLASLDVHRALKSVARLAVPFLGERCAVDLISRDAPDRLVVAGELQGERPPELHPSVLAGHSVIYTAGSRSHMAVPLRCRSTIAGAITVAAAAGREYAKPDLELLDELGRRAALSLENASLYEDARQALRARDEFLSVAAHEIRGPLTSIHLAVQSLLRGSLSSSAARIALEVIQREDRRLVRFVDELLDVGRIRTGQLHFELEPIDAGSLVRDVVSRFSDQLSEAGSSVTVMTEGELDGHWDRFRLEQVVTNLLANAVKYGGGHPIQLTVTGTGEHVRITVADNGIGIEPEMVSRIFDPFQRAVAARHYGGLGLGLHIARTIVEGLGGTIAVDSRPGRGSRFTVTLPVTREG